MKLLVIIAACNEAASLNFFLPRLMKIVGTIDLDTSILLIDDGSTDDTAQVASSKGCTVIKNSQNLGIGNSLRIGYQKAIDEDFDFVVTMDADGQHDEEILPLIIRPLVQRKKDILIASRYHKKSKRIGVPFDRDLLNLSVTAQMKVVTGWNLTDPLSGFWGVTKEYFDFIVKEGRQEKYGFHLENLINFWYLGHPRPRHSEIPHPAIYKNHGTKELLTRTYSPANKEQRIERFGTHARHIVDTLNDLKIKGIDVTTEIENRRKVFV